MPRPGGHRRDVAEGEYALLLSGAGGWALDGGDLAEAAQRVKQREEQTSLSDTATEVLTAVREAGTDGIRARELVARFGSNVYKTLQRHVEAGRLVKANWGLYVAPIESVRSVQSQNGDPPVSDTSDTFPDPTLRDDPDLFTPGCSICHTPLRREADVASGLCPACRLAANQKEAA